ncbi:ParB/RepB/Spo0J family partition protein [Pilimelia columellifera]|uniref:ParB-like N-terminal domain-containing protein n=1 Tax=Pilimelia columellifera subsp. columellifera TaxID=706583 RepID=A0ABP6ATB6_9ACTN
MTMTVEQIDPRLLVPNEGNLRRDEGDVEDLRASIRAVGILQPLVVTRREPVDGEAQTYTVEIGHRRRKAALAEELDTVPCLVAEDAGAALRIIRMLGENGARVGLTESENADAYAQLLLLDWTPEQITAATGRPVEQVKAAVSLAKLPAKARAAADRGALTLEDAAQLEEFADDEKTIGRLLKRGSHGWGLKHVIAEEKAKRERKETVARLKAQLVLDRVKLVSTPQGWGYGTHTMVAAKDLVDADGVRLNPEQVKTKPGFAAIIRDPSTAPRVEIVCTDPAAWAYRTARDVEAEQADPGRAEREAKAAALREALTVAAPVREQFVRESFGSARGAKKVLAEAVRLAVLAPRLLDVGGNESDLVCALAGTALHPAAQTASADRLNRMLVARWVGANETNLRRYEGTYTYAANETQALSYLDALTGVGYQLSDAETELYATLSQPGEDDEEQDDGGDVNISSADELTDDSHIDADGDGDGETCGVDAEIDPVEVAVPDDLSSLDVVGAPVVTGV